jgi:hypothetical protein
LISFSSSSVPPTSFSSCRQYGPWTVRFVITKRSI